MDTPPIARPRRVAEVETDPDWKAVELIQRGRMILDVAAADLEVAEARLGPFHPTSWFFRNALAEARLAWDRLRADFGSARLAAALDEPPVATLEIGGPRPMVLVPIGGRTYHATSLPATPIAPRIWRLTRLGGADDEHAGPYYASRLADDLTQCDCAEWTYHLEGTPGLCKHLRALQALGWL